MVKPNFFIVGAPRCGTTATYQYLQQHPDIFMPTYYKEPHYFGTDFKARRFEKFRDLDRYLALFRDGEHYSRVGEASVFYLYSRRAAQEIRAFDPDARIVAMVRNPVDMLYSYYYRIHANSDEPLESFEAALDAEADRKAGKRIPNSLYLMPEALYYSEVVKFAEQLQRYFDVFGREGVQVIVFDDLVADTAIVYRRLLEFLEVDPTFAPPFDVVNPHTVSKSQRFRRLLRHPWLVKVGSYVPNVAAPVYQALLSLNTRTASRPMLDPELRRVLQDRFAPEVGKLSALLDRDLTHWLA
jgi:hypothetical protein